MKRKDYETPSMTVVELRHQCCILAGSGDSQTEMHVTYDVEDI